MTRRHLFAVAFAGAGGMLECSAKRSPLGAKLASMTERLDLAIIPTLWTNGLPPEAVSASGEKVGKLLLADHPWCLCVSPDGTWVAWVPRASQPPPLGVGDLRVLFNDAKSGNKTIRLGRGYPEQLSMSSGADHLALITIAGVPSEARLLVLNSSSGQVESDMTGLISRFGAPDIDCLRISSSGRYLAVGTKEQFVVIDVQPGRVLLESSGRYPSLSPLGDSVAFVNKEQELVAISLVTRTSRKLMTGWWSTLGLGSWSPDGTFLLAGVRGRFSVFTKLVAIDCTTGEFVAIVPRLEEGNLGERSAWVKRPLLTQRNRNRVN